MTDVPSSNETASAPASTLVSAETQFVLHAPHNVVDTGDPDSTPAYLSDPLDVIIKQPFPIRKVTWTSAQVKGTTVLEENPVKSFLISDPIFDRISNRRGLRADFEMTIKINAPGGCKGALIWYLVPGPFCNSRGEHYDAAPYGFADLYQQERTAIFDASDPKDLVFKLPAHHIEPYMSLNMSTGVHWWLFCEVRSPLESVLNVNPVTASIRVYVAATGTPKFIGLVPEMFSGPIHSLGKSVEEKGKKAIHFASTAIHAVGDLAATFGFSKEINPDVTVTSNGNHRVLATDNPDTAENVAIFAMTKLAPLPQEMYIGDPLSFDYITAHESLVYSKTLVVDDMIVIPVCMGNFPTDVYDGPQGWFNTPTAYCAAPFEFYRVDKFIFNLRIFSSPMIKGDMYVYYVPSTNTVPTITDSWEVNTKKMIVSLSGSSCTEVTVNWNANARVLPVSPVFDYSVTTPDLPDNGMLVIKVGNLYSPKGNASVDIDVTLRTAGLQVMGLNHYKPSTGLGVGNTGVFGDITVPANLVLESGPTELTFCTKSEINDASSYDVGAHISGAPIRSLRALAQRPSLQVRFYHEIPTTDTITGYLNIWRLPMLKNTLFTGVQYDDVAPGTTTVSTYTTYAAYATAAYLGFKGSMRYSLTSEESPWRISEGAAVSYVLRRPIPTFAPQMNVKGRSTNTDDMMSPTSTIPYRTLSYDHPVRVQIPYDQPMEYTPCNWVATLSSTNWDYYGLRGWATISLKDAIKTPTIVAGSIIAGVVDLRIYSSFGDDFSVFMWKGVPRLFVE